MAGRPAGLVPDGPLSYFVRGQPLGSAGLARLQNGVPLSCAVPDPTQLCAMPELFPRLTVVDVPISYQWALYWLLNHPPFWSGASSPIPPASIWEVACLSPAGLPLRLVLDEYGVGLSQYRLSGFLPGPPFKLLFTRLFGSGPASASVVAAP